MPFGLVKLEPCLPHGALIDRLWLIFFGEPHKRPWWSHILRPGFRHVSAACWYDDAQRWVLYDPCAQGTAICLFSRDEFNGRFGYLLSTSAVVLRTRSRLTERKRASGSFFCVGAIKALLGIRSFALTPYQLHLALLSRGAEAVDLGPCVGDEPNAAPQQAHGIVVRRTDYPAGGPEGRSDAGRGGEARRG